MIMLHSGSVSDAEVQIGAGKAEGYEIRARVLLGGDTRVGIVRGANTRLGPNPAGACWVTYTRRVNSVPQSWAASLTLSYSLIPQVFPASHPVAFFPCSVKDMLTGLQRLSRLKGVATSRFTVIRSPVFGGVHQMCPVETHDQEAQK